MKTANPRKEIDPMNTNNTQYRIIKDDPGVYHFAHTSEACTVHHHSAVLLIAGDGKRIPTKRLAFRWNC